MTFLIAGLLLFLGMHSTRIVAEAGRGRFIAQRGEKAWKGLFTVVSLLGFALLVWGYGQARQQPVVLWASPTWARHLAGTLMLASMIFLVAAYVPGNGLKAKVHHPMLISIKLWALAHLLANNTLADLLLFGGFLLWAVLCFRAARQRDRAAGTVYPPGRLTRSIGTLLLGIAAWIALAFWLHEPLMGVRPM